jgi:C1A family cysteine protease
MGFLPPPGDFSHVRTEVPLLYAAPPSSFDWREQGKVTPVKHQGGCGSCYAFTALANFESRLAIDTGDLFDLSENNVKECSWYHPGCAGGNYWMVANHLSTAGTVLEACDPYVPADVACTPGCPPQHVLLDWRVISGSGIPSTEVLKSYLQAYGPLYTTMYGGSYDAWYSEFGSYDGSYTLYHEGSEFPNHAVLIVGWDDGLEHDGGHGAWIVKNSWGSAWGGPCGYGTEGGYFTIAYGSASIGCYASFACEWEPYDPGEILYYHDEAGYCGSFGYINKTGWALCKYVLPQDRAIDRVEFWTVDETTDIDIYIYDDFSGGCPSNLLTSKLNTPFANAGYHSVPLSPPLNVAAGNDVYVVVKMTTATSVYPLAYDHSGTKDDGSSYSSSNGGYFSEFTYGDLGIRIRTIDKITGGSQTEIPVIESINDVPDDAGGFVNVSWLRSNLDDTEASPRIKYYKIWRRRREELPLLGYGGENDPKPGGPYEQSETGAAWEVVGRVDATCQASYAFTAPTECDATGADTCWTYFCVTAHTGAMGDHYDSAVESGYSIDDQGIGNDPPGGEPGEPGGEELGNRSVLLQPEPNPGSGDFALRFELGTADRIRLAIYDVSGRRVAVLEDSHGVKLILLD